MILNQKSIQSLAIQILTNSVLDIDLKDDEIKSIINYFTKNKISLIDIQNNYKNTSNSFCKLPIFEQAYNEQVLNYLEWKQEAELILKIWKNNNIDFMYHKSVGEFPYLSDNLDVLVKSKDFTKCGKILIKNGYFDARNIQEAHKEFFRKFQGERIFLPFHLHERVCWSVPYEDIDHLWINKKHSSEDEFLFYPSEEDSILINTAHCFLEDHIVKVKDLLFIKKCINSKKEIDWDYITKTASKMHWERSLHTGFVIFSFLYLKLFNLELFPQSVINNSISYIKKRSWIYKKVNKIKEQDVIMPFQIPHLWTRRHSALRELYDPSFGSKLARVYQITGGLVDRFIHLKLKLHNQPGMLIAVSGLDGSGKTIHINSLINAFNHCEINTKYFWTRAGSLSITKFFSRIYKGKGDNISSQKDTLLNTSKKTKKQFLISFWRVLNIIDLVLFYSIIIRYHKLLNKVVICDRYYIDTLVDIESFNQRGEVNRIIYRIYKALIPKPDLAVYIKTPLSVIRERVKEKIVEDIDFNYKLIEKIIRSEKVMIIDNTNKFDNVSENLVNKVLTKYFDKYPNKFRNYKVVSYKYK